MDVQLLAPYQDSLALLGPWIGVFVPWIGMFAIVMCLVLRVAVEGSDNPVSLEKPCQASLPPDQHGRHSLGRQPEVQYIA